MTDDKTEYQITATVVGDTEDFNRQLLAALERPDVEDWEIRTGDDIDG